VPRQAIGMPFQFEISRPFRSELNRDGIRSNIGLHLKELVQEATARPAGSRSRHGMPPQIRLGARTPMPAEALGLDRGGRSLSGLSVIA